MDDLGLPRDRDTCHRLALDHVLALIAEAPWSSHLVLRGSMLMTAYAGSAARKPGDLDFIVVKDGWPVDDEEPYPYVDDLATVQQWPEVADGAGRAELWADGEFDTGGQRPRLSPDGVNWIRAEEWEESAPYEDLLRRIRENPDAGHGIVLDPERFDESGDWAYSGYAMSGSRVTIPWETQGDPGRGMSGVVQLDFAADEPMPRRPVWTRIPRLAGGFSVLWAAGPELSLVWKLMWLVEDCSDGGLSRGKDLYDAVVLAELPGLQGMIRAGGSAQAGLRRRDVDGLDVDWDAFVAEYPQVEGSVGEWKQRLMNALGLV
ncbi:nucleotidyl transferase AbiEii/AbiGii toxin family protein [Catenulispora rubra]|uniref:nucleotidyl transferase AbiEii/AbiGii toxin family protein n=1 Tax=Catenulispora rubra TaxID=280293 RepID=UPI00189216DB|nr:nucleotidyl transferase AbiEii/AbiGii toxin family protein [Catenulispora rubra]